MKQIRLRASVASFLLLSVLTGCVGMEETDAEIEKLKIRIEMLEKAAAQANDNAIALHRLVGGKLAVVDMETLEDGYSLALSDGSEVRIFKGSEDNAIAPLLGIDAEGYWVVSIDGGRTFRPIEGADRPDSADGKTPDVKIDADGYWLISTDGGKSWTQLLDKHGLPVSSLGRGSSSFFKEVQTDKVNGMLHIELLDGQVLEVPFCSDFDLELLSLPEYPKIFLGQTQDFEVRMTGVKDVIFQLPDGWNAVLTDSRFSLTAPEAGKDGPHEIVLLAVSEKQYLKKFSFTFQLVAAHIDANACKPWNDFVAGNEQNVLLDYSYAGYHHGEVAPAEATGLGYKVYDVTDFGAVPNDGKSDREAFIRCVNAALGNVGYVESNHNITFNSKEKANVIVYFPEGEFILHTSDDDVAAAGAPLGKFSRTIQIRAGNFVLRGAGRDKTILLMQDPNLPTDEKVLYSSPDMIEFKHNSGLTALTQVTGAAAKGSFSVEVASTSGISAGDWVCLSVQNNDPLFVAEELHPYKVASWMTDIRNKGVRVQDFHQVRKVEGSKVIFHEPIMRAVDPKWNWKIMKYPHYENVGIEDLCFKGNAKDHFKHHASWQDDGAFKPVSMIRLTDSWMRRVRFTSVSEASSISLCSNVSVYDVIFDGRRGHSAIRSAGSSRIFIGATRDCTGGYKVDQETEYMENAGQYHAVGVSKPSMGAVLWRNVWGNDSCFESHATQPRATLIDCCRGGWMRWRQGGDESQVPNHLNDLTIWNFTSTTPYGGEFVWWDPSSVWWKFVMPIIVGFNGEDCSFAERQMRLLFSNGVPVNPESLYEAQLKNRLGAVPAWLMELKSK